MGEQRTLVLSSRQTRENATERLIELFPQEHIDSVQRFVRKHMPDAPSFEGVLATTAPGWTVTTAPASSSIRVSRRAQLVSVAALSMIAASTLFGYSVLHDMTGSMLDESEFRSFAAAAGFDCRTVEQATADCTSKVNGSKWKVLATRAEKAGEPNGYRFLSGDQMAVVKIFSSETERDAWPDTAAYSRVYPYLTARDRVTIGATDLPVLEDFAGAADASVLSGRSAAAPGHMVRPATPTRVGGTGRPADVLPGPPAAVTVTPWPSHPTAGGSVPASRPVKPAPSVSTAPSVPAAQTGTPAPSEPVEADPPNPAREPVGSGGGITVELPSVTVTIDSPF
jgi:hypothetical protein